ncbi:hypothetical protein ACQ4PT_023407 [Festuca glaucescens]
MDNIKTRSCDAAGDFESPPATRSPSPPATPVGGEAASAPGRLDLRGWGKFWVADPAGCRGDEDAVRSLEDDRTWEVLSAEGSPSRPAPLATLDGFIARAEELGGSLRHGRRTAFAPGGKGSRFRRDPPPRFRRLGNGPAHVQGPRRAGCRAAAAVAPVRRPAPAEPAAPRSPMLATPQRPRKVTCGGRSARWEEQRPREVPVLAMALHAWLTIPSHPAAAPPPPETPVGMTPGEVDMFLGPLAHPGLTLSPWAEGVFAEPNAPGGGGASGPPKPPAPRDVDDDDVDDLDSDDKSDGERWNRHRRNDKTGKANDTQPGQDGGLTGGSGKTTRAAAPGSRSAPPLGKITDQYGPNLDCLPGLSLSRRFEALADLDRPETGDKVLDTPMDASLPGLEESLASGETISHVSDPVDAWLLDSPTGLVSDTVAPGAELLPTELDLRGEVITAISLSQGKRTKVVTVPASPRTTKKTTAAGAVRKSSRNQGPAANLLVLEKAKLLTKAKNLDPPSSGPGTNPFAALPSLSDSHISSIIADSCIVFVPSAGSREEAISLLRAKEQVQAALAEATAEKARQASVLAAREAVEDTSNTPGEGGADLSNALDPPAEAGIGKASSPPARITRSMSRSKRSTRPLLTARKGRGMKLQGKP